MDNNLKLIEKEIEEYKDTLVISHDKVYVLRGYTVDDLDYYYLLQDINGIFEQHSCVGEITKLRGYIEKTAYNRMKNCFQLNLDRLNKEII